VSLARVNQAELDFIGVGVRLLLVVSTVALTLALAGIYTVMSCTVARRTREIGIRVALGADQRRIGLGMIFRRPLTQVALGVCLLACIVPTRRALSIEPTEALRSDG
jgi:putative ABC transport system permease protein